MSSEAFGPAFQEALALEEYKSLRVESADAKRNQQTIFQWSMAAAGILIAASVAVTRPSTSTGNPPTGHVVATIGFLLVIPTLLGCAWGAWLGEVQRMERVGAYLRAREQIALHQNNLRLRSPAADESLLPQWESLISDRSAARQFGKNTLGSACACALFVLFFLGSLVAGVALTLSGFVEPSVSRVWRSVMLAGGGLILLAFVCILFRSALDIRRWSSIPSMTWEPSFDSVVEFDVVLPCYDESEAIHWVTARMPRMANIILIDDDSKDGSERVAEYLGVRVVKNPGPRGIGPVSNIGLASGHADIVCIIDCDGTFDPSWLPHLIQPIAEGDADLVIGARDPFGPGWTAVHRRLSNSRTRILRRKVPSLALTDLGSSRAIRRSVLGQHQIVVESSNAWSLDLAVKMAAATDSSRIMEVQVPYMPRIGRSKITGTWRGAVSTIWCSWRVLSRLPYRATPVAAGRPSA